MLAGIQKLVDEGHQPWQLNPILVAIIQLPSYGFTEDDLKTLSNVNTSIQDKFGKEISEIDLTIQHHGQIYIVTMSQSTSGQSNIWTTSNVFLDQIPSGQTYINEEYGFKVKTPQGSNFIESQLNKSTILLYKLFKFELEVFISVSDEPRVILFHGTFNLAPRKLALESASLDYSIGVASNNNIWTKEFWYLHSDLRSIIYYTKYNNKYYTIAIGSDKSLNFEKLDLIKQMLSTFRFLKQIINQ